MYFYLIKAIGKDDRDYDIDEDIILMHSKKFTEEQFDLLFDKIYTEWSQSNNSNRKIAEEMEKYLGFKIVEIINSAYVVELEEGNNALIYDSQEDSILTFSGNLTITIDRERGNDKLYEKDGLTEEEYEEAYTNSLKRIVGIE